MSDEIETPDGCGNALLRAGPQGAQFIAFDFETTGLNPFLDRIVEVGAVKFDAAGTVLGVFEQLANPGRPIPPQAMAVHGITDRDVVDAPPLDEVTAAFLEFIGPPTSELIAHNAMFDARFLAHELAREGLAFPENPVFDSIHAAARLLRQKSYALGAVAQGLGLRPSGAHRALADAMIVKEVVCEFIRRNGPERASSLFVFSLPAITIGTVGVTLLTLGREYGDLAAALREGRETVFTYLGGSATGYPRRVLPKCAYAYRGKGYLSALCLEKGAMRTFCLDLIKGSPAQSSCAAAGIPAKPAQTVPAVQPAAPGVQEMDWKIDFESDIPMHKQIRNIILKAIQSGEFAPHDRLPSVRDIAAGCGVNTNTVSRVLRDLQLQRIIYCRRGSGVFVAETQPDPATIGYGGEPEPVEGCLSEAPPEEAEEDPLSLSYDGAGKTCAEVFLLLEEARVRALSAGLDWEALVELFNLSPVTNGED